MSERTELRSELDKLISQLSGVLAAKTVLSEQGEIVEIHVLSDLNKSPKQLVRDIQSAVMSVHGLNIDYKMISIAQVNNNMVSLGEEPHNRLQINRIVVSLDSSGSETTVVLKMDGNLYEGTNRTPVGSRNRIQSAVMACLAAVQKFLGPAYNFNVLELKIGQLGGNDCVLLSLMFSEPFKETVLYGIAGINNPDTQVQAAVMAVLSALNRAIGKLGNDC